MGRHGRCRMTPRPYQLVGRDFLAARTRALLADQMRVGKTPQAIMAADQLGAERVLVLCPAGAVYQWQAQWAEWSHARDPAEILGKEPPSPHFYGVLIASYNRGVIHRKALTAPPRWDVLIADEAHYAKSPTAQRTKLVYGMPGVGWNATCIWALTGTPSPNHAGELWPMLRAFGVVKCTYDDFVHHFCWYDEREGRIYGNKKQHLAELRALLAPITLRRTLAEVAPDMPRIAYDLFAVEPQKGVDLRSDNPEDVDTEDRIAVALAKTVPLAQEICDRLTEKDYAQTVVFGFHVDPLKRLTELLAAHGIAACRITGETPMGKRENIKAAFKAGVCQVLVAQIVAAGTANDFSAAQHGYFLELDYVPDNNAQAAHRLVNMQTQLPVTFDVLTWPGTKDDAVQRTLLRKVRSAVFKS